MSPLYQQLALATLLFLFLFTSGFWTSRSGKPINQVKMNVHKFIALGAAVFVGITFFRLQPGSDWNALETAAVAVSGAIAAAAIVTGGLASLAKPIPAAAIIHKVTPWLALLSTTLALYLLVT